MAVSDLPEFGLNVGSVNSSTSGGKRLQTAWEDFDGPNAAVAVGAFSELRAR